MILTPAVAVNAAAAAAESHSLVSELWKMEVKEHPSFIRPEKRPKASIVAAVTIKGPIRGSKVHVCTECANYGLHFFRFYVKGFTSG